MNAQNTIAADILNALVADKDNAHTLSNLAKAANVKPSDARPALEMLVEEGNAERVGRRFKLAVATVDQGGDDDSIGADEAAILAAEGMLDDEKPALGRGPDGEIDPASKLPKNSAAKDEPKATKRTVPSPYWFDTVARIGEELAADQGLEGQARTDFIVDTVKRALDKLPEGHAAKLCSKFMRQLGEAYNAELTGIVKALAPFYRSASTKGSAGPRATYEQGKQTQPSTNVGFKQLNGERVLPYFSLRLRMDQVTKGDAFTVEERIVDGKLQLVLTCTTGEFNDDGTRKGGVPTAE
jgi:predicted transcriptional regulator